MRKIFLLISLFLSIFTFSLANERTEKETKIGVFLEDLEQIGEFEPIEYSPEGLFPDNLKSFYAKAQYAQEKIGNIFVNQKGLNDKYPYKMMEGMAYFEFFYMQQLKDAKYTLERFENKYPATSTKSRINKIYSLSEARKTMREAIGLAITDDPKKVLDSYYTMYKLFEQAKVTENSLSNEEKKISKVHNLINKEVSKAKSLAKKKVEQRIEEKKYKKEFNKVKKDLTSAISEAKDIKEYQLFDSYIEEVLKFNEKPELMLSGFKVADFILKDLKKEKIKNIFEQDLTQVKFDDFSQEELLVLGEITKSNNFKKNTYSNEIQLEILNLENGGLPVNRLLDSYRKDLSINLESLNAQFASANIMNQWALSDWANAWKSPIPTKIKDNTGIEVSLSEKDIQSIKAQLAIQNFKEIIKLEEFKELMSVNSALSSVSDQVNESIKNLNYSLTLDDFARALRDVRGLDINNYADLTALANAQYGANWSVEEYSSAYQNVVDFANKAFKSGISSFDAGQLARNLGASLQEVADTITLASSQGISVDLEAAAQGLGYGSFADAVAAYNAEHGTNLTVDQAREALGQ